MFLYGDLEEDIYIMQPHGYIMSGNEQLVCKLKKNIYGLKRLQDSGIWSSIDSWWVVDSQARRLINTAILSGLRILTSY